MTGTETARYLLIAGTLPLGLAALGHALLAARDAVTPRRFTPTDDDVRSSMAGTSIRFAPRWTNLWRGWIGFNISHGLGGAAFMALLFLIAVSDFTVFRELAFLIPFAAIVTAVYLVVAIRFWFFAPAILAGTSTALFIASAIVLRMA